MTHPNQKALQLVQRERTSEGSNLCSSGEELTGQIVRLPFRENLAPSSPQEVLLGVRGSDLQTFL